MINEFRDFIFRGNALALAIGVLVAGAFGKVVDAVVEHLLNPIIGAILGGIDLTQALMIPLTPKASIGIGAIIAAIISFAVTMLVLFILAKSFAQDSLKKE